MMFWYTDSAFNVCQQLLVSPCLLGLSSKISCSSDSSFQLHSIVRVKAIDNAVMDILPLRDGSCTAAQCPESKHPQSPCKAIKNSIFISLLTRTHTHPDVEIKLYPQWQSNKYQLKLFMQQLKKYKTHTKIVRMSAHSHYR